MFLPERLVRAWGWKALSAVLTFSAAMTPEFKSPFTSTNVPTKIMAGVGFQNTVVLL